MRLSLVATGLISTSLLLGCGGGMEEEAFLRQGADEIRNKTIAVTGQLTLSSSAVTQGETLTGQATLKNISNRSLTLDEVVLAIRPPGGTNGGGPFLNLDPISTNVTLAPGASHVIQGSRQFTSSDPIGAWYGYVTYSLRGTFTDGASTSFTVLSSSQCVPTTCAEAGKNCGTLSDGCGGTLSCGTCSGSESCGGGGVANVCGSGGTTPSPTHACTVATGYTGTRQVAVTGATANDSTDDTSAIQRAIDSASSGGGGVVTLPSGSFVINGHLVLKSNVHLKGAGPSTVLKAGPAFLNTRGPFGGYPLITTNGARNATLSNFTADQNGDVLNGNIAGRLNEYLVDVRYSENVLVDGVYTRNPFTYSIAIVASTRFCVTRSNTLVATSGRYNQLDGIHILDSSNGEVLDNTVDQGFGADGDDGLVAHSISEDVHDVLYAGNKVRGGPHGAGMQLALGDRQIYNIRIQNNEFWGNKNSGLHDGFYDTNGGKVHHVTVGGAPGKGNYFHDNGAESVKFSGAVTDTVVSYNTECNSGGFSVSSGLGNVVSNNTTVSTCR